MSCQRDDELAWKADAECAGLDPELFFPRRGENTLQAKAVCAVCPVRQECLDYALASTDLLGIWGGTSEKERRRIRSRATPTQVRHRKNECVHGHAFTVANTYTNRDGWRKCRQCAANQKAGRSMGTVTELRRRNPL